MSAGVGGNVGVSRDAVGEVVAAGQWQAAATATGQSYADTAEAQVPAPLAAKLHSTLAEYFGHTNFRDGQLEVVAAAVSGRDSCVYWSTGSGKSLDPKP